jgi:hypothetical protein
MRRARRRVALLFATLVLLIPTVVSATIEEQRARLPPAAECEDPIQGTWKSHAYYPGHGQWYIFTLTVRRDPQDETKLTGRVHSHYWVGGPGDEEPPPCGAGGYHQTVVMPAAGTVDGMRIQFGGTSWQSEQVFCGSPTLSYYPDVFSGVIDPELLEFQSVNNDGGPMVNYPTVFRRIACDDQDPPPNVVVEAPEFYPSTTGCGCNLF